MSAVNENNIQYFGKSESESLSPVSQEIVIGVVGYAGSGCSTVKNRLQVLFQSNGYEVKIIKLSDLIQASISVSSSPVESGIAEGQSKFDRVVALQNAGDLLRATHGPHAVASMAIAKIKIERGADAPGKTKKVFIVDSFKHLSEVELFRKVYDQSFRLVAVHCERPERERRLIGGRTSVVKYAGVEAALVLQYMDRDEKDKDVKHGQQVRDAFYLADFFIDNNQTSSKGENTTADLTRFIDLLLSSSMGRPTKAERAMYHASAAALQSSCLSRQVGAVLVSKEGSVIATGTNDVPKFGGGVYDEESSPDHRCFAWEWTDSKIKFTGCHNQRKKNNLRADIGAFLSRKLSKKLAELAHPVPVVGTDTALRARQNAERKIEEYLTKDNEFLDDLPGIKDLVEYSRAIHAEMNALFSAARNGISTVGTTLYCTTYPCHNCARHLVTAGVEEVFYIEPYVKSLASELHYDSISSQSAGPARQGQKQNPTQMHVAPFTGVGPRMYEDLFTKRTDLKDTTGAYIAPNRGLPESAVRLRELEEIETKAASLVPQVTNEA